MGVPLKPHKTVRGNVGDNFYIAHAHKITTRVDWCV